jgi:hypothetical protein
MNFSTSKIHKNRALKIFSSVLIISSLIFLFACDSQNPDFERSLEKINRKLDEKLGNVDSLINKNIEKIDSIVKDKIDSILIR